MSDAHSSAGHGGHVHGGPDHVPHVTPMPVYIKTFLTLGFLTIVTVGVSRIDLGTTVNLIVALVIATIKASVVAAFFMHLAADHKFHTVIFASSVVFLMIFISFTMFDTEFRGRNADAAERYRPRVSTDPFAAPSVSGSAAAPPAAAPASSGTPPPK